MEGYIRTKEAATYVAVSATNLERYRVSGKGPKFRTLGARIVVYSISDLDEWANKQVCTSTAERTNKQAILTGESDPNNLWPGSLSQSSNDKMKAYVRKSDELRS